MHSFVPLFLSVKGKWRDDRVGKYFYGAVLEQDGAPWHMLKFMRAYFAIASNTNIEWSPCSSNMNSIENCWR